MAAEKPTGNELSMKLDPKYDHYDFPTTTPEVNEGHPGHLTSEQQEAVANLRVKLEQNKTLLDFENAGYNVWRQRLDTLTLLRFLRARKFNLDLAETMFVNCETWRKQENLDKIVPIWTFPEKEKISKYYPQYYHKTDKDGRPVYIEQLGGIKKDEVLKISPRERMLTNLAVEYERLADPRLPAASRKAGHLLETCCTIMDLKGLGISNAMGALNLVQAASGISQDYYPERLGKMYLINAPWGFSTVWSYVKGWLDPVTVKKINVLSSSESKTKLLEQVPAENLPKSLGGTCECPGGCGFSDAGPWHEKEWAKPAKWETIENEPGKDTSIPKADQEVPITDAQPVGAPATAPAS